MILWPTKDRTESCDREVMGGCAWEVDHSRFHLSCSVRSFFFRKEEQKWQTQQPNRLIRNPIRSRRPRRLAEVSEVDRGAGETLRLTPL
jgi:hypothetical protein